MKVGKVGQVQGLQAPEAETGPEIPKPNLADEVSGML